MMQLLGQMMKLPLAVFVFSMELFVKTVEGMQRMADQGVDVAISRVTQTLGDVRGSASNFTSAAARTSKLGSSSHSIEIAHQATHKEEFNVPDQDLGGNDLKYVRY